MAIAVVFDISEKLDDFVKTQPSVKEIIFDYYLNFVFYFGNLFSSLLIFLSVLWFTSKLAQQTEIVAILSSGVSFRRLMVPYFIGATILVLLSLFFTLFQLPIANKTRLAFEEKYIRIPFKLEQENIHREIQKGTIMYFENYSFSNNMGYKFSIEKWNSKNELTYKLLAEKASYDSATNKWSIDNYYVRHFDKNQETITKGIKLDTILAFKPSDIGQRLNYSSAMTIKELSEFIKKEEMKGSDQVTYYKIDKYQRYSYPFAAYILTLIGVAVSSRKVRGGLGIHLATGVLIALVYVFAMKVATVAATNIGLSPIIAVWLPNAMFLILSIFLYVRAPK